MKTLLKKHSKKILVFVVIIAIIVAILYALFKTESAAQPL